jgi:hypothetical protein
MVVMMRNSKFAKGLLLLIIPIAPLANAIFNSPSQAATLGNSEATVKINDFSHDPADVLILAETYSNAVGSNGLVVAEADNALIVGNDPFFTKNTSFSRANGDGSEYSGLAQSTAAIIGYNFLIDKGETFSFNFKAALNLETSIDNSQFESATAAGNISFKLYETSNPDNWIYLDYFTLSGNLSTMSSNDSLNYEISNSFTLNPSKTALETSFGEQQETAKASTQGIFSRTFNVLSNLTLVEAKTNQAEVNANRGSVSVPESSNILGLLLCVTGMGYRITRKAFRR